MGILLLAAMSVISSLGLAQTEQGWEVSGAVTNDSNPVKGAYVIMTGPSSVPPTVTNGQGGYSLKGVVPGRYTIAVQKMENTSAPEPRVLGLSGGMRLKVDFRIPKPSVISGRVLDQDRRPVRGLIVRAWQKSTADPKPRVREVNGDKTNDLGEYRIPFLPQGIYYVAATADPLPLRKSGPASGRAPGQGYPPVTFHPDTRIPEAANLLELRSGEERTGVDILLQKEPARCISFKVGSGFAGERIGAGLRERLGFEASALSDGRVATGGSYEICGLTAGEYQLTVISTSRGTKQEIPGGVELARNLQMLGYQMLPALVDKQNVDLGVVEPLTYMDVRGTTTVQDARAEDSIPDGGRVRLVASELRAFYTEMRPARIEPKGTFVLRQVFAGDYGVRVDVPSGYYLIGAYQQGRSVSDGGFHPANGDLQIKLGADGGQVTGRTLTGDGTPIPDATVLLVPRERRDHFVVQSDQTGTFQFAAGVAPGEYRLVAVQDLPRWERTDPMTAARLAKHGAELKLGPRESRVVDAKVQVIR